MKKALYILAVAMCIYGCSKKKEALSFEKLPEANFNSAPFNVYKDSMSPRLKQTHDSCMGFSFNSNASFLHLKEHYFIGTIVNRQTLKMVNDFQALGLTMPQLMSNFNIISKPCYDKKELPYRLKTFLGEDFSVKFPSVDPAVSNELNEAISSVNQTNMQIGSWVYLDLEYALRKLLDTAKAPALIRYKQDLLDTSNMVLAATESITDVSFLIKYDKDFSPALQAFLKTKPSISLPVPQPSMHFFYVDDHTLQMAFNGFFPIIGEFKRAVLK